MRSTGLLVIALAACGEVRVGSDDVDAAGNYTIAVTNGENGCMFQDWMEGNTAQGIPLTIVQDGSAVTATVEGLTGGVLQLWTGSKTFTGRVDGDRVTMTLHGTRSFTEGTCIFTVNVTASANLEGDVMTGALDYTYATNKAPDCGFRDSCHTRQAFNGTRPPSR